MKSKLITISLILMLLVGLCFIFINPIQKFFINDTSDYLLETTAEEARKNEDKEASFDFEETQSLSIVDILKAQATRKDIAAIGSITIPEVDLELPIVKGVGKEALAVGAGTMKPDQQMGIGNYSLASHYFEGKDILFGPLYNAQLGDIIYLSDLRNVYEYEITVKKVIEATDVHIIDETDETLLTLITCAEEGTKRLAVQASFKNKYEIDKNPLQGKAS
ncbi:class A sortase [Ureibacillus sinduriensis]|uniref:Sortase n=1 Tax=Ureibacillus sinduriensis BLB-1 = JCM 15800 TaxID=1384057 RepID=A0A0A3HZW8_9BACL|nr:class A sortase [Ureibacillus sinduriensis]KGR75928.1 sortase [Ureibacillus sinduriensis BLB-1 = JCM 15800]